MGLCTINIKTLMRFTYAVTAALDAFILKAAAGSGRVWPLGKRRLEPGAATVTTPRWQLISCTQLRAASKSVPTTSSGVLSRSCFPLVL